MKPLWSREEARAYDADAVTKGISSLLLMENAGRGAADSIVTRFEPSTLARPVVLGGFGQNGGDAWVLARHLVGRGYAPKSFLLGPPDRVGGDARVMYEALCAIGHPPTPIESDGELEAALADATLIVDGLFGTGLSRPIDGLENLAIARVSQQTLPVVALDLPSGIDADTGAVLGAAIRATVTLTFGAAKRGLHQFPGAAHAGEVHCVHLGASPPDARLGLLEREDVAQWLAPRAADSHKGTAGHVAVFAGSPGHTGAALLSGMAAMRAGAGLVTLAARGAARTALDAKVIELMTAEIPEALEAGVGAAMREAQTRVACVLGPGVGTDAIAKAYLERLARGLPIPTVLDADALTAIAEDLECLRSVSAARVLTPHPGEAGRLLGIDSRAVQSARYESAQRIAERSGQVVVLKGARTIIAAPDGRMAVCGLGTPALGVAGTGDVLSGTVAAMLAQVREPFAAACSAVFLHARAGEIAARGDRGLFAREVADALPLAIREVLN